MIYSMTGFASLEHATKNGTLLIELRAVNHRYLELQMKLDDHLRSYESLARELISSKIGRGKIECRMSLVRKSQNAAELQIDVAVLQQLAQLTQSAQQYFPQSPQMNMADILRWPGVLTSESDTDEDLHAQVSTKLLEALQDLSASRAREGAKLRDIILARLAEMENLVVQAKPLLAQQLQAHQTRLTTKFHEIFKTVDEDRLQQELVLFAQRADVDEELTRLSAHISEVKRILNDKVAAGKRLDFLMQELNREANTLGSKSVSTEVTQTSMSLKVLIEQMREQIQNIE